MRIEKKARLVFNFFGEDKQREKAKEEGVVRITDCIDGVKQT